PSQPRRRRIACGWPCPRRRRPRKPAATPYGWRVRACRRRCSGTVTRACRRTTAGGCNGRLFLLLARVVGGVEVLDLPGAVAVQLDDGLALGPDEVLHAGGPGAERAGRHLAALLGIELIAHADVERSRDDGDVLRLGVHVRRDAVPVRELE